MVGVYWVGREYAQTIVESYTGPTICIRFATWVCDHPHIYLNYVVEATQPHISGTFFDETEPTAVILPPRQSFRGPNPFPTPIFHDFQLMVENLGGTTVN